MTIVTSGFMPAVRGFLNQHMIHSQSTRSFQWMCVSCKETLKSHDKDESQLAALESKVESLSSTVQDQMELGHAPLVVRVEQLADTVKEHMRLVGQSLREQERSVECQTKLIESSIRESHSQKAAYAEMVRGTCSEIVDKVFAKVSSIPQTVADRSTPKEMKSLVEASDSYVDKDKRKNNLVIYNLPEMEDGSFAERTAEDIHLFQEVMKDAFRMKVSVSRCLRAGKGGQGKTRLLIVTLDTPGVKQEILGMAPQLRGSDKWAT